MCNSRTNGFFVRDQNGTSHKVPNSCHCSLTLPTMGCAKCPLKAMGIALFVPLPISYHMIMLPSGALWWTNCLKIGGSMNLFTRVTIGKVLLRSCVPMVFGIIFW